jgi:sortase A
LAFGPGANPGAALPGASGRSVISGHRDTHFRFLQTLRTGDELHVQDRTGRWSRYRVTTATVMHAAYAVLSVEADDDALVLVTCYPFDALVPGGPLRFVVTAVAS